MRVRACCAMLCFAVVRSMCARQCIKVVPVLAVWVCVLVCFCFIARLSVGLCPFCTLLLLPGCVYVCPDVRMSCMEALAIVVRCFIFYIRFGVCAICYIKSRKSGKFIVKFVQFNGINMHTMLNCSTPKTKIFLDFLGLLWYNLTVR